MEPIQMMQTLYQSKSELQIKGGIENNSKIIFLISQ